MLLVQTLKDGLRGISKTYYNNNYKLSVELLDHIETLNDSQAIEKELVAYFDELYKENSKEVIRKLYFHLALNATDEGIKLLVHPEEGTYQPAMLRKTVIMMVVNDCNCNGAFLSKYYKKLVAVSAEPSIERKAELATELNHISFKYIN